MSGQNDDDLQKELRKLMNDAQNADGLIVHAESEKAQQEARLQEKLAKRRKAAIQDLQKETVNVEKEID